MYQAMRPSDQLRRDFFERYNSLKKDGYISLYLVNDRGYLATKLIHAANRNLIYLSADFANGSLKQKTNGKLVHFLKYD